MAFQMDFYAGYYEKVTTAIKNEKVKYPAYVFVRDNDGSVTGRLAFVDQNNELKFIRGENKQHVVNVEVLPDISEGDREVLYIVGDTVYTFNGENYVPTYNDKTAEIAELTEKITTIEEKVNKLSENVSKIDAFEHLFKKKKYDVYHKPTGTLVDYSDKEIRIMIPSDTDWTVQESASTTGNPQYCYIGIRVYAPDEATGFKESGYEVEDSDVVHDFNYAYAGVDEYGRKFSIVYLPAAEYDSETNAWSYFGVKSSASHYVGWNYSVEWYNSDGVVFASDFIRINLSNEECHYVIEPYYIGELETKVTTLAEAVESLENSTGGTFTELE